MNEFLESKLLSIAYLFLLKSKLMCVEFSYCLQIVTVMEKSLTLSERKRLNILSAAQAEFKEKGFLGASMDSLAKRAEVSKRTVYNHFPSKEVLFQAIVQQLCESFACAANVPYQREVSLEEQLMTIAMNELHLLANEEFRDLNRIILAEFIRSPDLATRTIEQLGQQEGGFNLWLNAAIDDDRINCTDIDYACSQFMGLIKAISFWPQMLMSLPFPSKKEQQRIAEDAVFMFLARYEKKA